MAVTLFRNNFNVYNAVVMLATRDKAAIIHPTGTGKSFKGFKLAGDNPDKIFG